MTSPSLDPKIKEAIIGYLKFNEAEKWWKHLGIPMNGSRIPMSDFNDLIKRINKSLSGWRAKLLYMAGKITLIKSTIYLYLFTQWPDAGLVFVLDKIEKLTQNFLWSNEDNLRQIHLISWSKLTKPKDEGGLDLFPL